MICVICGNLFAQSPKRKKLKNFGSSLERLKDKSEKNPNTDLTDEDVVRIDTSLVSTELLVLDKNGASVSGLTAADFTIVEDGQPQTVGHFQLGSNANVPRTIVLIIDYSGSQVPYLKSSIAAAQLLVDKLGPNDRMAIVTDDVELLLDFTDDKQKLKTKLQSLLERTSSPPGFRIVTSTIRIGRSMQYSALMATLNEAFEDYDVRPIIIFQTDGDEAIYLRNPAVVATMPPGLQGEDLKLAQRTHERQQKLLKERVTLFSLDDVYRAVEKSRATIYTVVPGIKLAGLKPEEQVEKTRADLQARHAEILDRTPEKDRPGMKAKLDEYERRFSYAQFQWSAQYRAELQSALIPVAALTGGWTEFLETPSQADAIYARIFSDINQRYIVGYYPSNKEQDGKRRKIDFEVKGHPEYQIYGRRAYFAPGP